MHPIIIKKLAPELYPAYLDFFDNRAFSDGNPNGPCYCTSPNQDEAAIQQMVSEFPMRGVKATLRKYAVEMLHEHRIQGYLAFDGDLSIGWCNAANIESYQGFVPDFARKCTCGKTLSIVCFEIAPEYRHKRIASTLIEKICEDAKADGYAAVEGYARIDENGYDFRGPKGLYRKAGFAETVRQDGWMLMRKVL